MGKITKESLLGPGDEEKLPGLSLFTPIKFDLSGDAPSKADATPATGAEAEGLRSRIKLMKQDLIKMKAVGGADNSLEQALEELIVSCELQLKGFNSPIAGEPAQTSTPTKSTPSSTTGEPTPKAKGTGILSFHEGELASRPDSGSTMSFGYFRTRSGKPPAQDRLEYPEDYPSEEKK